MRVVKVLAWLMGAVLLTAASVVAAPQQDQRPYCAGVFQSYALQLRCVHSENAARDRLYRRTGSFNSTVDLETWNYCGGIYDSWSLMERCIASEEIAKRRLGR